MSAPVRWSQWEAASEAADSKENLHLPLDILITSLSTPGFVYNACVLNIIQESKKQIQFLFDESGLSSGKYFNEGVTSGSVSNEYNGQESGERMVIITIYVIASPGPQPVSRALTDTGH